MAELIESSLENPPSLRALAQEVNMTPFQLSRLFRRYHGETIPGYIRRLRMARAASMLIKSNMMIGQISHAVGYQSLGAFVRGFTREIGKTPSVYRRETRANREKSGVLGLVAAWMHELCFPVMDVMKLCC
ncbi:helix-turn-helix transcriptional regulator [Roseimicrobium gellanilyticum]|uniref:helix-turn-helix transcriptional regulator n=1 Tax=Roseimicrobium gellanilyticum TaxID=748857 RepID=UPI0014735B7C|nr:AraC family transcriptional regulator [Roseimicrobium gellanilyticum]